jgi:lantibiotic biosynthesis protein
MIEIFPHVLMRIAGGPFSELQALNVHEVLNIVRKIFEQKEKKELLKTKLSEALFSAIQQFETSKQQNVILNIRRDIFNDRKISAEKIKEAEHILSDDIKSELKTFFASADVLLQLEAEGEMIFARELSGVRENFRKLVQQDNLRNGLLLSSKSLLDQMHLYLRRDSAALRKKELQVELGLTKYVTRIYAKTSPFSTFTNLAIAEVSGNAGKTFISADITERPRVVSHIRLNNFIFQYLKNLFIKNASIREHFLLRPNPTIRYADEVVVFLTNHNNVEAFQRIPFNPVLELLTELCGKHQDGISSKALIKTIIDNDYIEASAEELDEYIQQLVEYGFFEYNTGVSGIDPDWDLGMIEKLKPIAEYVALIGELIGVLTEMRNIAKSFEMAGFETRKKLLDEAYSSLRSICMKLHEAAGLPAEERKTREEIQEEWNSRKKEKEKENESGGDSAQQPGAAATEKEEDIIFKHQHNTYFGFRPEQLYYEDTTLKISPQLDREKLRALVQPVHDALRRMVTYEVYSRERIKMADYFENKYGKNARIDLLVFYEDLYRDIKKTEAEADEKLKKAKDAEEVAKAEKMKQTLPVSEKAAALEENNRNWQQVFAGTVEQLKQNSNESFHFGLSEIISSQKKAQYRGTENNELNSQALFIQFFTEKDEHGEEKVMGVINAPLAGFGKLFSRFLHIFDESVTNDLREWNEKWKEGNIFAEACDASVFNANLHPSLMPYETWMPGSQNYLPSDKQIPITDMLVCMDGDLLTLLHKPSEKKLFVFDLGFQGIMGRSHLYRLLSIFSLIEHLFLNPLINGVNSLFNNTGTNEKEKINAHEKKVFFRPRIVFENQLILQRKLWIVPKDLLPLRQPLETDWAYFLRVNEWRRKNEIPNEIFMFISDRGSTENASAEDKMRLGKDDYKPQYINFSNPLLMNLFEKAILKVPLSLRIEEMLPSSDHLFKLGAEKYVTEFLVQWYGKKNR